MSLILVGTIIQVKPEAIEESIEVRDCTEGKLYKVIPYDCTAEYKVSDSDEGGMVSFLDDVGDKVTIFNHEVTVQPTGA